MIPITIARSYGPIPGEDSWRHDRNPTPEVRKWKLPTRHRTSLWAPWTPTYKGGNNPAPLKARSVDPSEREGGKGYGGHPYSKRPLWKIHGPYDGGYSDDDIRPPRTPIYKGWNNPNPNGGNNPGAVKARSVDPFESEIMEEEETGAQAFTEGEGEGEFEDEFEDEFEGGEGEDEIEEVEEENFE